MTAQKSGAAIRRPLMTSPPIPSMASRYARMPTAIGRVPPIAPEAASVTVAAMVAAVIGSRLIESRMYSAPWPKSVAGAVMPAAQE